jgi:hypothetical protein
VSLSEIDDEFFDDDAPTPGGLTRRELREDLERFYALRDITRPILRAEMLRIQREAGERVRALRRSESGRESP